MARGALVLAQLANLNLTEALKQEIAPSPEAFSIDCAQASADGCIGCDGGTQCEKRHSTVLSWIRW